jgi:CubicO group peptidase (beta-lactamase class C family)
MRHLYLLLLALTATSALADAPTIPPAEDGEYLPPPGSDILFWTPTQKVAGFRNIDQLYPTRLIPAGGAVYPLPETLTDLSGVMISHEDQTMTLDDYFQHANVAGLLVLKDGQVVYERYGLGNTEETQWISFSVAKSVVSMLVGAAIQDGWISSVDDKVTDYLPRLKGTGYEGATIRNLLQMSSGVPWNEDYEDPKSDVATADWAPLALYGKLAGRQRTAPPGEVFNYNTAETNLVGTLLRAAVGNNLSTYLTEKIWQPFGMEADAYWELTGPGGGEFGGCCISATLRDYGRLGLFALHNGTTPAGVQVLPETWMAESTTPSKGADYYGYFWWLNPDGTYEADGIFGQGIYVDPANNVVIALHSARDRADVGFELQTAMFTAVSKAVSR